jgi:hypothetical protein
MTRINYSTRISITAIWFICQRTPKNEHVKFLRHQSRCGVNIFSHPFCSLFTVSHSFTIHFFLYWANIFVVLECVCGRVVGGWRERARASHDRFEIFCWLTEEYLSFFSVFCFEVLLFSTLLFHHYFDHHYSPTLSWN